MTKPTPGRRLRVLGIAFAGLLLAAPLGLVAFDVPNTFSNGATADASAINANFAALAAQMSKPPAVPFVSSTSTGTGNTTTRMAYVSSNAFVTLPSDGKWFVAFQARLYGLNCAGADNWWKARVVNERTGQTVNEVFALNCADLVVNADTTATGITTTTGRAGDVLRIQYWIDGSATSSVVLGDANGLQAVTAFRLGD